MPRRSSILLAFIALLSPAAVTAQERSVEVRGMQDYKDEISNASREMEKALVTGNVDLSAAEAVTVALFVRFLKRISSHSRNLVSSVVNPFPRIGYKSKDA